MPRSTTKRDDPRQPSATTSIEAIKRLRQAIGSLNREGRERLLAAFDIVNGHFQRLFTTLFGGGTAELTARRIATIRSRPASRSWPGRPARSRRR